MNVSIATGSAGWPHGWGNVTVSAVPDEQAGVTEEAAVAIVDGNEQARLDGRAESATRRPV